MTLNFQTWMQAVWTSLMEPSVAAEKALQMRLPTGALWTGLALAAVGNVLLLAGLQLLSPMPVAMQEQVFQATPFGYLALVGVFLVVLVFGLHQAGRMLGGVGTFNGTLTIVVWFQAISLTLEAIQVVLVLITPALGALFGMLAFGAMLYCFVNFVRVLHGFDNFLKAVGAIVIALIGTAFVAGIALTMLGISVPGGTT